MTEERRYRKIMRDWQKILRLQDWEIELEVVDKVNNMDENTFAFIEHIDYQTLSATIKIRSETIQYLDHRGEVDQEETIVHELLHILTQAFCDKQGSEAEERCINLIARALVRLKRGGAYGRVKVS